MLMRLERKAIFNMRPCFGKTKEKSMFPFASSSGQVVIRRGCPKAISCSALELSRFVSILLKPFMLLPAEYINARFRADLADEGVKFLRLPGMFADFGR